jgi:hypothetical protein
MAKKKASRKKAAPSQTHAVKAAWAKVRKSLTDAEKAMVNVVNANRGLMQALGKAGVSMTQSARKDLDARIRKLDISRHNAGKQLDALTKRLVALAKRAQAKVKPKAKRR